MSAVGIITGSDSDLPKIKECFSTLKKFDVPFEIIVSSAHRTPEQTAEWVSTARKRGIRVIIAAAGGAAHLPGVVSAHTTLPVIGIPIESNLAGGLDSLLAIAQMPGGIPVGTMAAGKGAGINAALYAVSILATSDKTLETKLADYRQSMKKSIEDKNRKLNDMGYEAFIAELEGGR